MGIHIHWMLNMGRCLALLEILLFSKAFTSFWCRIEPLLSRTMSTMNVYLDEVEACGAGDPFPGVDATVKEHNWVWGGLSFPALVLEHTFAAANADHVNVIGEGFSLQSCSTHHLKAITLLFLESTSSFIDSGASVASFLRNLYCWGRVWYLGEKKVGG